jgi:D-glucuronyl C5-epimerase C-terminus
MRGHALAAAVTGLFVLAGSAPATSVTPLQKAALRAVAHAHVGGATRAAARAEVNRAASLARTLPSGRREHVTAALGELVSFAGRLTEPRMASLLGELKANDDYFAQHYAPRPKTDITDADGVVYRYFAGRCFEFHPLANFGALNAVAASGDPDATQRLAEALIARGVYQTGGGIAWEYTFPYGGRAPWTSGMAQAVAAQAFMRAASVVTENATAYANEARSAYRMIPRALLTQVAAGPWIRLYSFSATPVLNAQLQTVISLQSYATAAEDADAATLASRLQRSAAAMLTRFDTGYWTYYALPNDPSPLDYQQYVVQLLKRLAKADPRFATAASRFAAYEKQPPAFKLAPGALGALTFWVSKPTTISVVTAAGRAQRRTVGGGWHTFSWPEPKRPGDYPVRVSATDWAGNHAGFAALPFVRVTSDATAPAPPPLAGAALADPSESATAVKAGIRLVRVGVAWPAGATAPDPGLVAALQQVAPGARTVLELAALPTDDAGRSALAQYAAALVPQVPSLQSLVLAPAPTAATAPAYAAAFAALRAALRAIPLGVALDGSTDPKGTLAALGSTGAGFVAFRPAAAPAKTAWTLADLAQVSAAFPSVLVDGLPTPYAANTASLACVPSVSGVVLDQLADAVRAQAALAAMQRGSVVCPGVSSHASASRLEFPDSLAQPVTLQLACDRDCLYLAELDRSDGKPVVARRGALAGGVTSSVALPKAKLKQGTYTIVVRLIAQVNPGDVSTMQSPALVAG